MNSHSLKTKLILSLLCLTALSAQAREDPSFSHLASAWKATDIVVATEGDIIDGKLQVLEVSKGTLKAGDQIIIPELAAFAPQEQRSVSPKYSREKEPTGVYVSGSRIWLFLLKSPQNPNQWTPTRYYMKTSVAWVDGDQCYAFRQFWNPGSSLLTPMNMQEEELRAQVTDALQIQNDLAQAVSIADPTQRAQALRPFIDSTHYDARQTAFKELGNCGQAALPILRAMLNDEALLPKHALVVEAMGTIGGQTVGPELTRLVETETKFWKQKAPQLKMNWWNEAGGMRQDLTGIKQYLCVIATPNSSAP